MNQSMEMEIVKTLAIPKLMLSVIPVPKQLIKEQTQYFTILYRMGKIK